MPLAGTGPGQNQELSVTLLSQRPSPIACCLPRCASAGSWNGKQSRHSNPGSQTRGMQVPSGTLTMTPNAHCSELGQNYGTTATFTFHNSAATVKKKFLLSLKIQCSRLEFLEVLKPFSVSVVLSFFRVTV